MKKLLSISLLLLFLFQATSSLWILASFYANRNYISKNICINRFDLIPICEGQCYLADQLKKNEKQEQKLPELKQKEVQLFYQVGLSSVAPSYTSKLALRSNFFYLSNYTDIFIAAIFQPPQYV